MAIEKFFAKYGKPKYAFKMIMSEIADAKEALKKDELPTNREIFMPDLTDQAFLDLYERHIEGTFPEEMAEAVVKIKDFVNAHGYNIEEYVKLVERYCDIKSSQNTKTVIRYV